MPLVNCKECGKAFSSYSGRPICPSCEARLNAEYESVRDYIKDNPQTTLDKVSQETGISTDRIRNYIKEGLLDQVNLAEPVILNCQICKKPIASGNYCAECMNKLRRNLKPSDPKSGERREESKSIALRMRKDK